jgi:GAF domain-containing protein
VNTHRILVVTSPDDPQLSEAETIAYRECGFASAVCIPLVANEELYGFIEICDTRERDYSEHLPFLQSAGQIIAAAFETSLLVEQLRRSSDALREIAELGALVTGVTAVEEVLVAIAERLRATVDATDCDIFTLQDGALRCLVSIDRDGRDTGVVGNALDLKRFPATAMAVHERRPAFITSLSDPRLTTEELRDMSEHGYQSEVCIPLVRGKRVLGIIDLFDTRPRDYAEYHDFIRSVGYTAAAVLENAVAESGL